MGGQTQGSFLGGLLGVSFLAGRTGGSFFGRSFVFGGVAGIERRNGDGPPER
jgi:hypothetical protein